MCILFIWPKCPSEKQKQQHSNSSSKSSCRAHKRKEKKINNKWKTIRFYHVILFHFNSIWILFYCLVVVALLFFYPLADHSFCALYFFVFCFGTFSFLTSTFIGFSTFTSDEIQSSIKNAITKFNNSSRWTKRWKVKIIKVKQKQKKENK